MVSKCFLTMAAVSMLSYTTVEGAECDLTISILKDTDYSYSTPNSGADTPAVIITGARQGETGGGKAMPDPRCVYYYRPDSAELEDDPDYDSKPNFTGDDWPYAEADQDCKVNFDSSVPEDSIFREEGYVQISKYDGVTFGGLPTYFYPDDKPGEGDDLDGLTCVCNFGPWTSVDDTGEGAHFSVEQRLPEKKEEKMDKEEDKENEEEEEDEENEE
ncbi:hypothetical protein SARC_06861 [Sphaeroforma arctica JP610]|uniref:Generative cell specific-1/HAP2 domain-containing protein n=1 Tax=Sphaeroforma arctica JP610 TaxID=667725 RepID=A0A0L0FVC3_9EUKA|nr:hypothetical protein SARC_06861 [Sphaeroforma arctica JP610]KNC80782.1 hypothetical protein SARC_06861 [Sphaeroforma arctica JP610]|eukprot:XP_014154684.1 hypothetical protein SARC_06861 [Sphaeroforma arctica JP610]